MFACHFKPRQLPDRILNRFYLSTFIGCAHIMRDADVGRSITKWNPLICTLNSDVANEAFTLSGTIRMELPEVGCVDLATPTGFQGWVGDRKEGALWNFPWNPSLFPSSNCGVTKLGMRFGIGWQRPEKGPHDRGHCSIENLMTSELNGGNRAVGTPSIPLLPSQSNNLNVNASTLLTSHNQFPRRLSCSFIFVRSY